MIPTVPLIDPPNMRQNMHQAKLDEKAYPKQEMAVPKVPMIKTILRPHQVASAAFPHHIAVRTCAPVKAPCSHPAWLETSASESLGSRLLSW